MPHVDHQPLWIDGSVRRLPNLEESLRQLQAEMAIQLIDHTRHKHFQCLCFLRRKRLMAFAIIRIDSAIYCNIFPHPGRFID